MDAKKPSIVIVNTGEGQLLLLCLRSLTRSVRSNIPIIVVQNGPDPATADITLLFPSLHVVSVSRRPWGAAANVGLKKARRDGSRGVVLLSPVSLASEDFITPLLQEPNALTSPILSYQQEGKLSYLLGQRIHWPFGNVSNIVLPHRPPAFNRRIDILLPTCLFLPWDIVDRVGPFHAESDAMGAVRDYCLAARQHNVSVRVEPRALVFHQQRPRSTGEEIRTHLRIIQRYGHGETVIFGVLYGLWFSVALIVRSWVRPREVTGGIRDVLVSWSAWRMLR